MPRVIGRLAQAVESGFDCCRRVRAWGWISRERSGNGRLANWLNAVGDALRPRALHMAREEAGLRQIARVMQCSAATVKRF
jgi:hypothetical protein